MDEATGRPRPGDRWRCKFDPAEQEPRKKTVGPTCEILEVNHKHIRFQWLGSHYQYIDPITTTIPNFLRDFNRVQRAAARTAARRQEAATG